MKKIYTILLYLVQPLICLRLLFYSFRSPAYRYRWDERYGFCKYKIPPKGILLHAVSVGETLTSVSLVRALQSYYPFLPITITTMTPTASERVMSIFGKNVHHVYLPYDLPFSMRNFFNVISPKLVIVMETELWPNMISILYQRKIPLVIANARLSNQSAEKYKKINKFMRHFLNKITLIAAQNKEDAARFFSLGVKANHLAVIGNLKFDFSITSECIFSSQMLRRQWAKYRPVWIAASTHQGEESIVLQAHQKLLKIFPNLLLILVPRHPERFKDVQKIVKKANFNFILRSTGEIPSNNTQVVIGDTMGELMLLYGISDIAFVGGSLVKRGGHNPLEPAAYAIPILMGKYTFNFKSICDKLQEVNGLITVINVESLVVEITNLLTNKNFSLLCGCKAAKVFYQNKGALCRLLKLVTPYLLFGNINVNKFIRCNDFKERC